MQKFKTLPMLRRTVIMVGAVLGVGMIWPIVATAQDKSDEAKDPVPQAKQVDQQRSGEQNLATQIAELRDKVGRLESLLGRSPGSGMTNKPSGNMESMGGKIETKSSMEGMDMDKAKGMSSMGGDKAEMGGATMAMMDQQMMQMMQMMQQVMEMKIMGIKSQAGGGMGMEMKDKGMDMKEKDMDMKDKAMDMKGKGMDMKDKGMGMMAKDKTNDMGNMEGGRAEAGGSASGTREQQVKQMMQMQALQMKMMAMKMRIME